MKIKVREKYLKLLQKQKIQKENTDTVVDPESNKKKEMSASQIKIEPQREFIIDQQRLVIENKNPKKSNEELKKSKS